MSRSRSIYVVFDEIGRLIATFTVKYEMADWIKHRESSADIYHWQVWRYPDNPGYGSPYRRPTLLKNEEVLA